MEYDDDSDCPSEEEGLGMEGLDDPHDEDLAGEEDDDDSPTLDDSLEDEGTAQIDWSFLSAEYIAEHCEVDIAGNDIMLCRQLRDQANHLLDRIREKCRSLHYDSHDHLDAAKLTNCFLPIYIWHELKSMMDQTLTEPVRMRELELLLRFLFAVGAYQTSVGSVLKNPAWYGKAEAILNSFQGGAARVKELLVAMDPSSGKKEWNEPFARNRRIQELERMISRSCSEMAWKSGFDLCIDDDKVCIVSMFNFVADAISISAT